MADQLISEQSLFLAAVEKPTGAERAAYLDATCAGRPELRSQVEALLAKSRDAEWCSLVNGAELYVNSAGLWDEAPEKCITYNVYYTGDFLRAQFPGVQINNPVNEEMQHCCELSQ